MCIHPSIHTYMRQNILFSSYTVTLVNKGCRIHFPPKIRDPEMSVTGIGVAALLGYQILIYDSIFLILRLEYNKTVALLPFIFPSKYSLLLFCPLKLMASSSVVIVCIYIYISKYNLLSSHRLP